MSETGFENLEKQSLEKEMIDKFAQKIVDTGMATPAIFMLEIGKPLNFIGAQTMNFFGPIVESFMKKDNHYYEFTEMLEDRGTVEKILMRIEEIENNKKEQEKNPKKNKKRISYRYKRDTKKKNSINTSKLED